MLDRLQKWCEECGCWTYDWMDENGEVYCAVCGMRR